MEFVIILALLLVGLVLFGVEVFVTPGISLAGMGAAVSLLGAVGYAFGTAGTEAGLLTLSVALAGIAGLTVWFVKSGTVDRLSLKQTLGYPGETEGETLRPGERGKTLTRLALIGNADFSGRIAEVQSAAGFIEENAEVEIVRIEGNHIFVRLAD